MYSYEIKQLLELRDYIISNEEYFKILETSPQIKMLEYKPYDDIFELWTDDRYNARFKVYKKEDYDKWKHK